MEFLDLQSVAKVVSDQHGFDVGNTFKRVLRHYKGHDLVSAIACHEDRTRYGSGYELSGPRLPYGHAAEIEKAGQVE
ncbi:hypothetical protein D9M68_965590 [compost metagenome]